MTREETGYFPFLERNQLNFEHGQSFDLEISTAARVATPVEISGMTRHGAFTYSFVTTSNSLLQTTIFKIPDIPISVSVKVASGTVSVNNVYAMVYLRIAGTKNMLLCQGMLGHFYGLSWPNQPQMTGLQLRGKSTTYTLATTGLGVEFSVTIPPGQYWKIQSIYGVLHTSANIITRSAHILITHADGGYMFLPSFGGITAGLYAAHNWFDGAAPINDVLANAQNMSLPHDFMLPQGTTIATVTTNYQANDEYILFAIYMEIFYSQLT